MNALKVVAIVGMITGQAVALLCHINTADKNRGPVHYSICSYTPMTNTSTGINYHNDDRILSFMKLLRDDGFFQVNLICMNEINLGDDRQRSLRCYCGKNYCNTQQNFEEYIVADAAPVSPEEMAMHARL
uniref:Activin_recp domain-containing protein n=1 Tax=Steinernema glaseri TaxID=37863 RepID=A0A1I8APF5_9BILA